MNNNTRERTEPTTDPGRPPLLMAPGSSEMRPLLRVYTLGPLTLEWAGRAEPFPQDRLHGRGAASALLLLKTLISRPHRYAARDWLSERLHSAEEEALSPGRLDDLASLLRGLLCPPVEDRESRDRLRRELLSYVHSASESGPGYRLGSYPLIWVDIDALQWYVEQACRLERFGEDALPLWERAYALAKRGEYLIDEPYSDWAEPRRAEATRYLRQSVHALSRLYLAQEDARAEEEALRLLGDYWQQHVEDEDALRPLMELLGRHERYQEALAYYEQLCEVLEEEGRTPDARTTDLKEFLRTKQLQRSRAPQKHEHTDNGYAISALSQQEWLSLFTQAMKQGILQAAGELERGGERDKNIQKSSEYSPQSTLLLSSWSGVDVPFDPSRRSFNIQFFQFLCSLTGLAAASFLDSEVWDHLQTSAAHSSALNQSSLNAFQDLIEICWQLCNDGKMDLAEHLLLMLLPSLQQLADRQPDAARLTAECFRLLSVLSAHQLKLTDKLTQCWQSVHYARLAGEPNTLAASLHELTAALRYTGQPDPLFLAFQEALSLCEQLEPPLRAGIYAGAAAAFAQRQRRKEADFYIHLAYEVAQESSAQTLALADNSLAHLAEYEGLLFLELGQPQQAYAIFDRFTSRSQQDRLPERNRLEMLNYQGLAALRLGELDLYASCLERGIEGALVIGSKKRLQEAFAIYQQIPRYWRDETYMRQVVERFHLPVGGVN